MKLICQLQSKLGWFFVLSFLLLFTFFLWQIGEAAEIPKIPTIEELTGGKLKVGDLVTKENVDLVKGLIPQITYESIKRGMKLILAPTTPPELTMPAYFLEATEKNKGKAVIGKNDVIYTKDGGKWPGGVPFPDPKTGVEAMGNYRFIGMYGADDYNYRVRFDYVNKKGESYKYNYCWYRKIMITPRLHVPPLKEIPGHELENYRQMTVFVAPWDLKGISMFFIRHYDDTAYPDEGYIYLPAFKRTRRIAATNWQESVAGSDMTWGDQDGFAEPYSLWNFKLLEKKFMILPGFANPIPKKRPDETYDPMIQYDVGKKFPRVKWEVRLAYVVEATPKGRHIYGKKILYLDGVNFGDSVVEMYDRQMKLWKTWTRNYSYFTGKDGFQYAFCYFTYVYDLQMDHMTGLTSLWVEPNAGAKVDDFTLAKMLELVW